MLNPFPELLTFGLMAPFALRIVAGFLYIQFGFHKLTKKKEEKSAFFTSIGLRPGMLFVWIIGLIELIGGIMLLAGFYTQIAAIALSIIMLGAVCIKLFKPNKLPGDLSFFILLFVVTLSFVFSGAGAFAFDLPL